MAALPVVAKLTCFHAYLSVALLKADVVHVDVKALRASSRAHFKRGSIEARLCPCCCQRQ